MPEPSHVTIGGKRWKLRYVSRLSDGTHGDCDGPHIKGKTIRIKHGLGAKKELEVLLHECLHAADWHRSEEWVQQTAVDLCRMLWQRGWRPTEGE